MNMTEKAQGFLEDYKILDQSHNELSIYKENIPLRIKAIKVGTFAVLVHIISKMYKLAISRCCLVEHAITWQNKFGKLV